jgi:hypothetical protein
MLKIVIATLIAGGVALAAASAGSAAPVNNMVLKQAETTTIPIVKAQYWRYRYGYYHHPRCHGYYSGWHWC